MDYPKNPFIASEAKQSIFLDFKQTKSRPQAPGRGYFITALHDPKPKANAGMMPAPFFIGPLAKNEFFVSSLP
jgi:hypothetical protein